MKLEKDLKASDRAYATLLGEIQAGTLKPGFVLAETEQAARLGVSRTPAREAIQRLITDGLARQLSPRVTVVTELDAVHVAQLFAVRQGLETVLVHAAAATAAEDPQARRVFAELAEKFRAPQVTSETERENYYALVAELDAVLDAAVKNPYLAAALAKIRTHLVRVRKTAKDQPERLAKSAQEHYEIIRAIALGDGNLAENALKIHLHHAREAALEALAHTPQLPKTKGAA